MTLPSRPIITIVLLFRPKLLTISYTTEFLSFIPIRHGFFNTITQSFRSLRLYTNRRVGVLARPTVILDATRKRNARRQ